MQSHNWQQGPASYWFGYKGREKRRGEEVSQKENKWQMGMTVLHQHGDSWAPVQVLGPVWDGWLSRWKHTFRHEPHAATFHSHTQPPLLHKHPLINCYIRPVDNHPAKVNAVITQGLDFTNRPEFCPNTRFNRNASIEFMLCDTFMLYVKEKQSALHKHKHTVLFLCFTLQKAVIKKALLKK